MIKSYLLNPNDLKCPRCRGGIVFDAESGESVCTVCGMVTNTGHNSSTSELYPQSTGTESITGSSSVMYFPDLSTLIDDYDIDANGKQINDKYDINKIRKLNNLILFNNSKTRNLMKARWELRRIVESLAISTAVAERAWYIYRKALKKNLIRGRSIRGLIAATAYIACRDFDVPCSIDQISYVTGNLKKKTIAYYCKLLLREIRVNVSSTSPSLYVPRIAKSVGLSAHVERKALEILEIVQDHEMMMGKRPLSLAAAAVYLASMRNGGRATQLRIANATNLNTNTIRKRCLEITKLIENAKPNL